MHFIKRVFATSVLNILVSSLAIADDQSGSPECVNTYHPYRMTVRHIEPEGIGYDQGYTTLEGFFPLYNGDEWIPFLDVRGHVFNNGKPAINAGLGARYLAASRVWGINAYYDYRNTKHQHYNQVAMGLESLGVIWDFRLNGYLPVGKKQSAYYDTRFDRFEGNSAILRERYEYALAGFNGEVGAHVDRWDNIPLYFAAGSYYLTGKGSTTWGGQFRTSIRIFDYLKIEGNVSYDHLFKWIGQGQVGLSFSFGSKSKTPKKQNVNCSNFSTLVERSYQPIDRFEIIPVDKKHANSAAIDPLTGLPYQFIFVDNMSASLGTYESPYHDLTTAETASLPYNIIYIFPGDGTTTGLDQGITLKDYQKLWGSGVNQMLTTTSGRVSIPAQSNSLYNGVVIDPIITNASGSVVTVANMNEISGLFLANQGSNDCITSSNASGLSVLNSTLAAINAPGAIGINATELTGVLLVSQCDINQATNGILLQNSAGSLNANISNTNFSFVGGANAAVQWILTSTAQGDLNVSDCVATVRNNALEIDLSGTSAITTLVKNNTFTTGSYGVYLNSTAGATSINANIKNNTMTTYYQSVWVIQTGDAVINLVGNNLLATSEQTFEIDSNTGSAAATLTIANNSFTANNSENIYFNHSDGDLTATITNNIFKGGNYNNCIRSNITSDANIHALTISQNTLAAGQNGIEIDQQAGAATVLVNNNTISGLYSSYGLYWNLQGTPISASLVMNGNTVNCVDGIYLSQNSPCEFNVALNNNVIDSSYTGFNFQITNASVNNLALIGNKISGFAPIDLTYTIGTINTTLMNNVLTAAGNQALFVNSNGSIAEGSLNVSGNTITAGGLSGSSGSAAYLFLHATGPIATNFTNNTFNGDAQALTLDVGGATHTMNLSNNIIPTGGGFSLTANSGSGYWIVNSNEFTALSAPPVNATASGGDVCLELNHNTAYPVSNAYNLTQTSGTFTLNPTVGNIGDITESGTITHGTCP